MATRVHCVENHNAFRQAGPRSFIRLRARPGQCPLILLKADLEALIAGIVHGERIHLSGPTGTGKTALVEALSHNWRDLCAGLGFPYLPLRFRSIEMAIFEAPGELWLRRAVKDGTTYDEPSVLVRALEDASRHPRSHRFIWMREIGRAHSASVQGGLLDLMSKSHVQLPEGTLLDVRGIAWVADSNYQAVQDYTHTLVTLDVALARRFTVNITLDYFSAEQDAEILRDVYPEVVQVSALDAAAEELIAKLVQLVQAARRYQAEGSLRSVPPPTFDAYFTSLRMARALPRWDVESIARYCLFGHASAEDRKLVAAILSEVLGLTIDTEEEMPAELF